MSKDLAVVKEVAPLVRQAGELVIEDAEGLKNSVALLSELNQINDKVEEDRLRITKPLNDSLKEVNGRYKPIKDLLVNSIASVKLKMGAYQAFALKAKAEAEDKLSARVAKGTMKLETAVAKLENLEPVDKSVDSEAGSVTFIEVEKFEVTDIEKLPGKYLLPNEKAIREALKEGVRLEGVRYYKEQMIRNNRG